MRVWRIERAKHVDEALSGVGARLYGGRWNTEGTPLVYTSSSLSLAAFERFVHAPRQEKNELFYAVAFDIPFDASDLSMPSPLPNNWRSPSPSLESQRWGDALVGEGGVAAAVPSVLIPLDLFNPLQEFNVLLNPESPLIKSLKVAARLPYAFDLRAWK